MAEDELYISDLPYCSWYAQDEIEAGNYQEAINKLKASGTYSGYLKHNIGYALFQ